MIFTALNLSLAMLAAAGSAAAAKPATDLAVLADRLVRDYYAGNIEALRPHLAPELRFRDPGLDQRLDLAGFLETVARTGAGKVDRELEIAWTGVVGDQADVRGTWSETDAESGRRGEHAFSIVLDFDTSGERPRVISWLDDFRRRMRKPIRGDGELQTAHFRLVYLTSEFSPDQAARLGETLERWYGATREYLDRSFPEDYRLQINVAGAHGSPFASDPGPRAFMLVPLRSARRDYGFSLVHELTHNLMGLSWLCRNDQERAGVELSSGNRLFDEGFAVYVEEKLTGEGPRVFPNFGEETHAAYWKMQGEMDRPIGPILEAEIERERGDTRFGYLAQASFCKYLVETYGLDRFVRLFVADPAAAGEIYGKELAELELGWREFLEARFAPAAETREG